MKAMHKIILLTLCTLLACSPLLGCALLVPEQYTDGVRLDRNYPEDDMPIMDDALVYFSEGDDETITIKYGVNEDLDDVVDFYKDHFEDNEIVLDDESDRSSRYNAEGIFKDFKFDVRVTKPSGEYEEKVFETTVKIQIEFLQEPVATVEIEQSSLEVDIIGFWRQESFEDEYGKETTVDQGIAYEFRADGTLVAFDDFEYFASATWSVIDQNTLFITAADYEGEASVILEKRTDGYDFLTWTDSSGTLVFYRSSSEEFNVGDDTNGTTVDVPSADDQLAAALADVTWYYIHYSDINGQIASNSSGSLIYHSDGTLVDVFDDKTLTGTWYISDGWLHCDYSDGTSSGWIIEIKDEGGTAFLYYYSDSEPGAFWLYADSPSVEDTPAQSATFTTDADVSNYIAGVAWNELYYQYSDGSTEPMTQTTFIFYAEGTFDETFDGVLSSGTWYVKDGVLYMDYTVSQESYHYPVYIKYDADSDSYYLYFGDLEEGFEGNHWIFTTYTP